MLTCVLNRACAAVSTDHGESLHSRNLQEESWTSHTVMSLCYCMCPWSLVVSILFPKKGVLGKGNEKRSYHFPFFKAVQQENREMVRAVIGNNNKGEAVLSVIRSCQEQPVEFPKAMPRSPWKKAFPWLPEPLGIAACEYMTPSHLFLCM